MSSSDFLVSAIAVALGACTGDPAMLIAVHRDDAAAGDVNIYVCTSGAASTADGCEDPTAAYGTSRALDRSIGLYTSEGAVTLFFSTAHAGCSGADVTLPGGELHASLLLSALPPVLACDELSVCLSRGCVQ